MTNIEVKTNTEKNRQISLNSHAHAKQVSVLIIVRIPKGASALLSPEAKKIKSCEVKGKLNQSEKNDVGKSETN